MSFSQLLSRQRYRQTTHQATPKSHIILCWLKFGKYEDTTTFNRNSFDTLTPFNTRHCGENWHIFQCGFGKTQRGAKTFCWKDLPGVFEPQTLPCRSTSRNQLESSSRLFNSMSDNEVTKFPAVGCGNTTRSNYIISFLQHRSRLFKCGTTYKQYGTLYVCDMPRICCCMSRSIWLMINQSSLMNVHPLSTHTSPDSLSLIVSLSSIAWTWCYSKQLISVLFGVCGIVGPFLTKILEPKLQFLF